MEILLIAKLFCVPPPFLSYRWLFPRPHSCSIPSLFLSLEGEVSKERNRPLTQAAFRRYGCWWWRGRRFQRGEARRRHKCKDLDAHFKKGDLCGGRGLGEVKGGGIVFCGVRRKSEPSELER
jgi:hypothetical protein